MPEDTNTPKNKNKTARIVLLSVLALVLVAVCGFTVYVSGYDTVFPNVCVGNLNLESMTRLEVQSALDAVYDARFLGSDGITLSCGSDRIDLSAEALEIAFCNADTADAVIEQGRVKNPFVRAWNFARQKMRPVTVEPVISYRSDLLTEAIDRTAAPYETEPVGYTFEIHPNTVVIHAPVAGVKVDRDAVIAMAESQIKTLALSAIELEPITTPAEPLNPDEFYDWLTAPAENAFYTKDENGTVTVSSEKLQCSVDKETVKQAIASMESSGNTTASFAVTTTEPEVLASTLTENLYKDKLGSYTTHYGGTAARSNNLRIATARINGYELMPGEEFSYDKTILPRTAANGYQAAPVYVGNKVESGMGGGICQPSSTLYGAALYANLEILERHNHSMQVSYMPPGLDATISQGVLDLRLRNSTDYPVKISAHASGGVLTFTIWGYNPDNISVDILRSGSGYTYTATRVVKKNGEEIHRESLGTSRYVPPEPSATPEPTESAAPQESAPPTDSAPEATTPTSPAEPTPTPAPQAPVSTPEPTPPPAAENGSVITE